MTIVGWLRISGIRWVRISGTHTGHSSYAWPIVGLRIWLHLPEKDIASHLAPPPRTCGNVSKEFVHPGTTSCHLK